MRTKRHPAGFSLIELLIVVAIILVIAAIAIPNFLTSRMAANEASAVSSIRNINTAQIGYASVFPTRGFADTLTKLAIPPPGEQISEEHGGYLDWVLGCTSQPCPKSGYTFQIGEISGDPVSNFKVFATPISVNITGRRGFCSDQLSKVMVDASGGTSCTVPLE